MARKVKFPLKMADGAQVRNLEELREHFDLKSVLGYYENGRLTEWLTDRYYENETGKVNDLDTKAKDFKQQLCRIFGVSFVADEAEDVDLTDIAARNERRERLKAFTADDKILAAVDRVAFTQEELADLLDDGVTEVYLCGESFRIPLTKKNVTYIGVNNPVVIISAKEPVDFESMGLFFEGTTFCDEYAQLLRPTIAERTIEDAQGVKNTATSFCENEGYVYYFIDGTKIRKAQIGSDDFIEYSVLADGMDHRIKGLCIDGDWLYYCAYKDTDDDLDEYEYRIYMYRCSLDGKIIEKCCAFNTDITFLVHNQRVFYTAYNEDEDADEDTDIDEYKMYCMETDGSGIKTLSDCNGRQEFALIGRWIYYFHNDALRRLDINSGANDVISTNKHLCDEKTPLYFGNDEIYFLETDRRMMRFLKISLDGKDCMQIASLENNIETITKFYIKDKMLYFVVRPKPLAIKKFTFCDKPRTCPIQESLKLYKYELESGGKPVYISDVFDSEFSMFGNSIASQSKHSNASTIFVAEPLKIAMNKNARASYAKEAAPVCEHEGKYYYCSEKGIYRIGKNGGSAELVCNMEDKYWKRTIQIDNGFLYSLNHADVARVRLEDAHKIDHPIILGNFAQNCTFCGEWVYYYSNDVLVKKNIITGESNLLIEFEDADQISDLHIVNNDLYFINKKDYTGGEICRLKHGSHSLEVLVKEGVRKTSIGHDLCVRYMSIANNVIYFALGAIVTCKGDFKIASVNLDGKYCDELFSVEYDHKIYVKDDVLYGLGPTKMKTSKTGGMTAAQHGLYKKPLKHGGKETIIATIDVDNTCYIEYCIIDNFAFVSTISRDDKVANTVTQYTLDGVKVRKFL